MVASAVKEAHESLLPDKYSSLLLNKHMVLVFSALCCQGSVWFCAARRTHGSLLPNKNAVYYSARQATVQSAAKQAHGSLLPNNINYGSLCWQKNIWFFLLPNDIWFYLLPSNHIVLGCQTTYGSLCCKKEKKKKSSICRQTTYGSLCCQTTYGSVCRQTTWIDLLPKNIWFSAAKQSILPKSI